MIVIHLQYMLSTSRINITLACVCIIKHIMVCVCVQTYASLFWILLNCCYCCVCVIEIQHTVVANCTSHVRLGSEIIHAVLNLSLSKQMFVMNLYSFMHLQANLLKCLTTVNLSHHKSLCYCGNIYRTPIL